MKHDSIAVIDFGGQYAHLIATKVRRNGVLAEIRQPDDPTDMFRPYKGIILSGSPSLSAFGEDSAWNKDIFNLDVPILGYLRDTQNYVQLAAHGLTLWDVAPSRVAKDVEQWSGILAWLGARPVEPSPADASVAA